MVNGKIYIGQTIKTIEERYKGHIKRANNGCKGKLYPAMRKYGINNFKVEQIDEVDASLPNAKQLLDEREMYWIAYYNSTELGYNITIGGDLNRMFSPECIKNHKHKLESVETRQNISNGMKLYRKLNPFTQEHIDKINASRRKRKLECERLNIPYYKDGNAHCATRNIACYCKLDTGEVYEFDSYKSAAIWWFDKYKPFGEVFSLTTYQRKINKSILGESITYSNRGRKIFVNNIKWFKKDGGDVNG